MADKYAVVPLYDKKPGLYDPDDLISVKRGAITYPIRPPIREGISPKTYELDNKLGGPCKLVMHMQFASAPDNEVVFPFQLVEYMQLKQGGTYSMEDCYEMDTLNREVYNHNEYLVQLMTDIIRLNGCKTSAGVVTQVGLPDKTALEMYTESIQSFLENDYERLKYAMQYMNDKIAMLPVRDYDADIAISLSDAISYFHGVVKRIESSGGTLQLEFTGQPTIAWDGISGGVTTALGYSICWKMSETHCSKSPVIKAAAMITKDTYEYEDVAQSMKPKTSVWKNCNSLREFVDAVSGDEMLHSHASKILDYVFENAGNLRYMVTRADVVQKKPTIQAPAVTHAVVPSATYAREAPISSKYRHHKPAKRQTQQQQQPTRKMPVSSHAIGSYEPDMYVDEPSEHDKTVDPRNPESMFSDDDLPTGSYDASYEEPKTKQ